jgi:hypothetical protein
VSGLSAPPPPGPLSRTNLCGTPSAHTLRDLFFSDMRPVATRLPVLSPTRGLSGAFLALMESDSAVLKAGVFAEFWERWAVPDYSMIPLRMDNMLNGLFLFRMPTQNSPQPTPRSFLSTTALRSPCVIPSLRSPSSSIIDLILQADKIHAPTTATGVEVEPI